MIQAIACLKQVSRNTVTGMALFVWCGFLLLPVNGNAAEEALTFSSPEKKALYEKLTYELRCLKCQNQNLADSPAGLAEDLKAEIFKMVEAGQDSGDVIDFMVQRYGDFILYRPAFKPLTAALWLAPFVLLGIGFMVILRMSKSGGTDLDIATDGGGRAHADGDSLAINPESASLKRARELLDSPKGR